MSNLLELLEQATFHGQFATYTTICELRRGGMGVVLLADVRPIESDLAADHQLEQVVIKVSLRADEHAQGRMAQEITALQALQHPQVVSVVDHGQIQGHSWYAMEYVGPCNLGDILLVRGQGVPSDLPSVIVGILDGELSVIPRSQRVGLPISSAVTMIAQVADIVAHAHSRGVLHRDLKPANILLDDSGAPVLCDFGVARAQGYDVHLTAVDEVVGTIDYIASEQLIGAKPDERSDVYAMGAMLHECLSGQLPPRRRSALEPLPALRGIPSPLVAIVNNALHPQPDKRMRSAGALAADLRRFHQGQKVLAANPSIILRLMFSGYRRPMTSGFTIMALILTGLLWWAQLQTQRLHSIVWEQPILQAQGSQLRISSLSAADPSWSAAPHGQAGIAAGYPQHLTEDDHVSIRQAIPPRSGQRISIAVDTGSANQEISLFLSSRDGKWQNGYTFQLGAYDNTCSILRRGHQILWMGAQTITPNQRLQLTLERHGSLVRVWLDGKILVSQRDLLPLTAYYAGVMTYLQSGREYVDPAVYRMLSIQTSPAPREVDAEWILGIYASAMESQKLTSPARRELGRQAMVIAEAMAKRLPLGSERQAVLRLRQESLRRVSGSDGSQSRDLEDYSEQLGDYADYYLHQISQVPESPVLKQAMLTQAQNRLTADEQARFILGLEQHLRADQWPALYRDILAMSHNRPLEYDYILWRVISMAPASVPSWRRYWELVDLLARRGTGSFWQLKSRQLILHHERWRLIASAETALIRDTAEGPQHEMGQAWQQICRGATWVEVQSDFRSQGADPSVQRALLASMVVGNQSFDDIADATGAALSSLVTDVYRYPDWASYQRILKAHADVPAFPYDQELRARHLAVALLLAHQRDEIMAAIPVYMRTEVGAQIEIAVAGVITGHVSPATLGKAMNFPEPTMHMLRWLSNPGPLSTMPAEVPLNSALGPLLRLAQAQRVHQLGNTVKSEELLQSLAADREWLPTTQAAQAIIRWGW